MTDASHLEAAFDAAIDQAQRAISGGMVNLSGQSAEPELKALVTELEKERGIAVARGHVDAEWFQRTLRWIVQWAPDTDLTLIAALGRIVRAQRSGTS